MITFFDPILLCVAGSAFVYLMADARVRHMRGHGVPRGRRLAFLGGLAVIVIALEGPVDDRAATSFSVHMIQHLLLTMGAAPLLLIGAPLTLALRASAGRPRRRLLRVLHSGPARLLAHPLVAWATFFGFMWAAHLSSLYEATLRDEGVHALEHVAFLGTALLFWMPVIRADPTPGAISYPARILYLFVAMPAMAFLGLAIASAAHVMYPTYARIEGVGPAMADQRAAGALMWGASMVMIVLALGCVLWEWMGADEREGIRLDARLASGGGGGTGAVR